MGVRSGVFGRGEGCKSIGKGAGVTVVYWLRYSVWGKQYSCTKTKKLLLPKKGVCELWMCKGKETVWSANTSTRWLGHLTVLSSICCIKHETAILLH